MFTNKRTLEKRVNSKSNSKSNSGVAKAMPRPSKKSSAQLKNIKAGIAKKTPQFRAVTSAPKTSKGGQQKRTDRVTKPRRATQWANALKKRRK